MKIRILGNSCSGKTTVGNKIANHYNIRCLHLDSVAFIPNSNFESRPDHEVVSDVRQFISGGNEWILEGNYMHIVEEVFNVPDLIIFIDLPVEQSLTNFKARFKQYQGMSRPELPNLIETEYDSMIEWISDYPQRKDLLTTYIVQEQMQNPFVHILHLEDMGEVEALCNNPNLLDELFT